jgi:hypothetical protein
MTARKLFGQAISNEGEILRLRGVKLPPIKFELQLRKESDMEGLVRKATLLCLVFLLLLSSSGLASLPKASKRVLLLYSEEKADPAHELTDQGIRAVFRSNKLFDVQLYTEYLVRVRLLKLKTTRRREVKNYEDCSIMQRRFMLSGG